MNSAEPNYSYSPQIIDIITPQHMYRDQGAGTGCFIMIDDMFVDEGLLTTS